MTGASPVGSSIVLGNVKALSILIPSLPERAAKLARLMDVLVPQLTSDVELLVLTDNRSRPLGQKRNAMMETCQGVYVAHIDDDDLVTPNYVAEVLKGADASVDVVAYDSRVFLDDHPPFVVHTSLTFENEQLKSGPDGHWVDIRRKPWHWCAWNRRVWKGCRFGDDNVDEDWSWLCQVIPRCASQAKIDKVLHEYHHRPKESLCQAK